MVKDRECVKRESDVEDSCWPVEYRRAMGLFVTVGEWRRRSANEVVKGNQEG